MSNIILIASILCSLLISGCSHVSRSANVSNNQPQHKIYVVYRDWHTSVVLDAALLAHSNSLLASDLQAEQLVRIGWGDGDYFTGKNNSLGSASKALLVSQYSALQVLTYSEQSLREIPAATIVPLVIDDDGFYRLINHINNSLALSVDGNLQRLPAFNSDTGVFFQATGHYSLFNNCNTWTSHALQLAGLPLSTRLTAQGVFSQAREISRRQQQAGLLNTAAID